MTAYYIVEEPDEFFADDFGNDDAPAPSKLVASQVEIDWDEEPDEFFADDFGNDSLLIPATPRGLTVRINS